MMIDHNDGMTVCCDVLHDNVVWIGRYEIYLHRKVVSKQFTFLIYVCSPCRRTSAVHCLLVVIIM